MIARAEVMPSSSPRVRHLSVSKVATAVEKCMLRLKWELDLKEHKIPVPTDYSRVGGTAFHSVVEWALGEVVAGRKLPSVQDMTDLFPKALEREIDEQKEKGIPIIEKPDDPPETIADELMALIPVVRDSVLAKLEPVAVEHEAKIPVEVEEKYGGSFIMWVKLDVVLKSRRILDWKTTRNEVKNYARKLDVQMMGYGWVDGREFGTEITDIWKVFLVRGYRPRVEYQKFTVLPMHREFFERSAREVWRATQDGNYVPNISSFLCSKEWCPFWDPCRGGQ